MGCVLGCFGGSEDRKRRRSPQLGDQITHQNTQPSLKQIPPQLLSTKFSPEAALGPIPDPDPELRVINEQGSFSARKKVTFDLNIKTYEAVSICDDESHISDDDEEPTAIEEMEKPKSEEVKFIPESVAYPPNHRYQNCESGDDEDGEYGKEVGDEEEEDYEDDDIDTVDDDDVDDDDDGFYIEENEESYESYFSRPADKELQITEEVDSPAPRSTWSPEKQSSLLLKGNPRDRSRYVHPVLNPVENLSQWKKVKFRATPVKITDKENADLVLASKMHISPNPLRKQEVSVDASLSTWLTSSGNSTIERTASITARSNPSLRREEQTISGAWTVENMERSLVTSSSRSPSRIPGEIAIMGTVDAVSSYSFCRYNSDAKGIPNTTSKYREDKVVNWHSTPFEVRLERALNKTGV